MLKRLAGTLGVLPVLLFIIMSQKPAGELTSPGRRQPKISQREYRISKSISAYPFQQQLLAQVIHLQASLSSRGKKEQGSPLGHVGSYWRCT